MSTSPLTSIKHCYINKDVSTNVRLNEIYEDLCNLSSPDTRTTKGNITAPDKFEPGGVVESAYWCLLVPIASAKWIERVTESSVFQRTLHHKLKVSNRSLSKIKH